MEELDREELQAVVPRVYNKRRKVYPTPYTTVERVHMTLIHYSYILGCTRVVYYTVGLLSVIHSGNSTL